MIFLDARRIEALVKLPALVDALEQAFCQSVVVPERQLVPVPGGEGRRLLLSMPAFAEDGSGMVKLATVFPDNRVAGLPTIQGAILAFSASGEPQALLDGACITRLRTAAASALASRYLSRPDSRKLVLIGTGALAPHMAAAHACVRPISEIAIWGRDERRVAKTISCARKLLPLSVSISTAEGLGEAVGQADIVSCATSASEPVLRGEWLKPGTFVDLVGSFSPENRECDDETVKRASLYVDTLAGTMVEAGDIFNPMARGIISRTDICGELADLVTGKAKGRQGNEITLFKSVGTALEDFAAARLALQLAMQTRSE